MDKNIGIGLLIGLTITSTFYVFKTERFNKIQKITLYLLVIFPPAQWVLMLVFLGLNYAVVVNSKDSKDRRDIIKQSSSYDDKLQKLKDLHEDGYLTDIEYSTKADKLESEKTEKELELTDEYKKLKSLYDDGILTKEEFESKIYVLSNSQSGFLFHKIKDGTSSRIGDFEEYYIENNYGKKHEHIYKAISNNKFFVYKKGEILFFDSKTEILKFLQNKKQDNSFNHQNFEYNIADKLKEGYYLITDININYGFADKYKNIKIEPRFEFAESFSEGLALVRLNNKFGFIDYNGRVVIDIIYDDAESFKNGMSSVVQNNTNYYLNRKGKKV